MSDEDLRHLVYRDCIDCGTACLSIPDYPTPRCEPCMRRHAAQRSPR